MTFTKTSQKFGQWIDFKLNLVYGLGFPNDSELNKFVDKFKEIKEFTRSTMKSHERSNSCEITTMNRHHMHNVLLIFFEFNILLLINLFNCQDRGWWKKWHAAEIRKWPPENCPHTLHGQFKKVGRRNTNAQDE